MNGWLSAGLFGAHISSTSNQDGRQDIHPVHADGAVCGVSSVIQEV